VEEFVAPVIFLIVLFVGFGLAHRRGQQAPGCSGCTSCSDKSECTNKDVTDLGSENNSLGTGMGSENHFLEK